MFLIGNLFPSQYCPENNGCKQRWKSIYFSLDSREPKWIGEGKSQRTNNTRCQCKNLKPYGTIVARKTHGQPDYSPVKKQDGCSAYQRRKSIYKMSDFFRGRDKQRHHPGNDHIKRCTGGMANLQFVSRGYKFATVPETYRGFNRK